MPAEIVANSFLGYASDISRVQERKRTESLGFDKELGDSELQAEATSSDQCVRGSGDDLLSQERTVS